MLNRDIIELAMILNGEERRLAAILSAVRKGDTEYLEQGLTYTLEEIRKAQKNVEFLQKHYKM